MVLDERSPTLLALAIERFSGHSQLNWVRADSLKTGTMNVTVERLMDGAGNKWSRYLLQGDNLKASVLRDSDGKTVHIDTGWGFTGIAKGRKVPKDLKPDAATPAEAAPATEANKPAPAKAAPPAKADTPKPKQAN